MDFLTLRMIVNHQSKVISFEDMGKLPQVVCQVHLKAQVEED